MQGEQQKTAQTADINAQIPQRQAETAHTQEQTAEMPATSQAENELKGAQTKKIDDEIQQGPQLATAYAHAVNQAIQEGRDPAQDPIVGHLADAITGIQKAGAQKSIEKVNLMDPKTKQPYAANHDLATGKYMDAQGKEIINPVPYEKPNVTNVNMGEKTFEYSDKQLETLAKPLRERSDRIERLRVTMSQGNPQADALIGPELLTAMAGGQGSGLRMNEAEIARIVGGRSEWENLKANLQHWSTNPQDARSITPEQDTMIRKLVEAINDKVQRKMTILNDAGQKIVNVTDPKLQHQLIADTRKALQQEDAEQHAAPADADNEVYVKGQLVGHTVNGKYVPLGGK